MLAANNTLETWGLSVCFVLFCFLQMLMNALLDQTAMSMHLVSTQMDPMFALASLLIQEMVKNVQVWERKASG